MAHIGVIKALHEFGLRFSHIAGTSAGSIVGALYAHGYNADEMVEIISQVTVFRTVRPAWTRAGLLNMDGFRELLLKYLPQNSFEELKIPLTVAATDIKEGKTVYFTRGELVPAIVSSCSIPALFNPVEYNGGLYVDGGLLQNLPASALVHDCDFIVGSHCNPIGPNFDASSMRTVIERSLLMAINANTQQGKELCDVVIEPKALYRFGVFELAKAKEIFDIGYSFTMENFSPRHFEKALS